MYTFTNKLRNFSISLMVIGFLGLVYGFLTVPDTVEEASAMVADAHHGEDHGEASSKVSGTVKNPYTKPKNPTNIKVMEKFLNLFVKLYMPLFNKLFVY